jgi:ribosomal protein L29
MGQIEKPSRINIVRKEIAKIKTQMNIIKEKKNA